ncbi:MAG: DUF4132 domain-containing protein [Kofleriaceae bacterium]
MQAELEARIEADPDDPDPYYVYGDWLQTHGDPRGELIALQAAAARDPANKKLTTHVNRFFEDHATELLGELAAYPAKQLGITWQLGFARDVRIDAPKQELAILRTLLAHPTGRFIQSLAVAHPRDPDEIVRLLVDLQRPKTLSDLRLGRSWDSAQVPELVEMFPRLARSLDAEWRRIAAAIAAQRKTASKYDASVLPALVETPDTDTSGIDKAQILTGLRMELGKGVDLGLVAAMKRAYTPESLDQFAVELARQYFVTGENTTMRWGFQALGKLGGASSAMWIADRLSDEANQWSHGRAAHAIAVLADLDSSLAIWELAAVASDPRLQRGRRQAARGEIERIARTRKLAIDAMLDRTTPLAGRESRIQEAWTRRLRAMMIDGRKVSAHDFTHHFVRHPFVAPLVRRLVWATYEHGVVEATFRIDDDSQAVRADGSAIDLEGASIGVLHPAELEPDDRKATLAAWSAAITKPLFDQLDRPILTLRDQETGNTLTRFKLRAVGFEQLRTVLEREAGWAPIYNDDDDDDYGRLTVGWERTFGRDGVTARAGVDNGRVETVELARGDRELAFTEANPVTVSEILLAVDRATTRETAAIDEVAQGQGTIVRGSRVDIRRGEGRLRCGVVFWIGEGRGDSGVRLGVRTETDETYWVNAEDVLLATDQPPPAEAPAKKKKPQPAKAAEPPAAPAGEFAFAKGTLVNWAKGRNSGSGTVFWVGKNKFGDGNRVGVKDAETGETVWADERDCTKQ